MLPHQFVGGLRIGGREFCDQGVMQVFGYLRHDVHGQMDTIKKADLHDPLIFAQQAWTIGEFHQRAVKRDLLPGAFGIQRFQGIQGIRQGKQPFPVACDRCTANQTRRLAFQRFANDQLTADIFAGCRSHARSDSRQRFQETVTFQLQHRFMDRRGAHSQFGGDAATIQQFARTIVTRQDTPSNGLVSPLFEGGGF